MRVEIEDHKDLYRDTDTKGLAATTGLYEEYKKRVVGQKRINTVIDDVQYLKEEMSEIKQLLKDIKDGS
jgi:hypothetical protein